MEANQNKKIYPWRSRWGKSSVPTTFWRTSALCFVFLFIRILQQIIEEEKLDGADRWSSGGKSLLPNKGSV